LGAQIRDAGEEQQRREDTEAIAIHVGIQQGDGFGLP
jgi:hypothetical protein